MDELLPRIQAPTLVMAATASDRAPTSDQEHLARRIPNARLEIFAGHHHNIAMQVPDRCDQDVGVERVPCQVDGPGVANRHRRVRLE